MGCPRVLVLITLAETGGAQSYVASLLPALVQDFDVTVAAHCDGFLRDASLAAGARYLPLQHVRRPLNPWEDLRGLGELVRLFRRERFDLIHANSSKAGFLGRLAAVAARVPARLFTVHGWAFKAHHGVAAAAYLWADRLMSPLTTTTICVAESERRAGMRARTCSEGRTVVIYNGVELPPPHRPDPDPPVTLLSVGRLREPKDFLTLVRAIAALEHRDDVRLRIAGDGPDRPALEQEIARHRLHDRVELLGTRDDVDRLLADSGVFVLSSDSEGMPMSVLEAMAAGVPVVASAVGGVPEVVRDGETGALVPPRDPAALARAIDRLVADPRLRHLQGDAGRSRAERVFGIEEFRRRHLDAYRAALGR
jgi:glycosyltransferase involved in cell wall biosynthesis